MDELERALRAADPLAGEPGLTPEPDRLDAITRLVVARELDDAASIAMDRKDTVPLMTPRIPAQADPRPPAPRRPIGAIALVALIVASGAVSFLGRGVAPTLVSEVATSPSAEALVSDEPAASAVALSPAMSAPAVSVPTSAPAVASEPWIARNDLPDLEAWLPRDAGYDFDPVLSGSWAALGENGMEQMSSAEMSVWFNSIDKDEEAVRTLVATAGDPGAGTGAAVVIIDLADKTMDPRDIEDFIAVRDYAAEQPSTLGEHRVFEASHPAGEPTGAGFGLFGRLLDPSSVPTHAWYGVKNTSIVSVIVPEADRERGARLMSALLDEAATRSIAVVRKPLGSPVPSISEDQYPALAARIPERVAGVPLVRTSFFPISNELRPDGSRIPQADDPLVMWLIDHGKKWDEVQFAGSWIATADPRDYDPRGVAVGIYRVPGLDAKTMATMMGVAAYPGDRYVPVDPELVTMGGRLVHAFRAHVEKTVRDGWWWTEREHLFIVTAEQNPDGRKLAAATIAALK